jgi:threonine dehydratase
MRMEEDSLADSLVGGTGLENRCTFRMVQEFVDHFALVSKKQKAEAMALALEKQRLVVEGSSSLAAAYEWSEPPRTRMPSRAVEDLYVAHLQRVSVSVCP